MRTPEAKLAKDGKHFFWSHECNFEYFDTGSNWHPDAMLPIADNKWRIEQKEPLTISPSILCGSCGTHGYWKNGKWESL